MIRIAWRNILSSFVPKFMRRRYWVCYDDYECNNQEHFWFRSNAEKCIADTMKNTSWFFTTLIDLWRLDEYGCVTKLKQWMKIRGDDGKYRTYLDVPLDRDMYAMSEEEEATCERIVV